MNYECKITVLETKVFPELQEKYLADPKSGPCPCFKAGDTFLLKRTPEQDDFYHLMNGKFCGEAWDAISRYVYAALQGGSIMRKWTIDMKTKEENQDKPFVFIDAFCGGGKIGLSIPTGFFDFVVINDLDWGVYNYFKYVKENPELLIRAIEVIGQEFNEEKFFLFAKIRDNQRLDGLLAGALTWWTTYSSFNGMTDFDKINYALPYKVDNSKMILKEEDVKRTYEKNQYIEHEAIEKSMALARKKIPALNKKMSRGNYIVENMDY